MTKKQAAIVGILGVLGATTVLGIGFAGAATKPGEALASKIATAFHLNKDDVQKVIDQNHADNQADRQQKLTDRLNQAVTDGKITATQKDKIVAKLAEVKTFMDGLKDKTPAERREALKTERTQLEQWAKDNGINIDLLRPMGRGMGRGFSHSNQ